MDFVHNENQIALYSENNDLLAEITFPYTDTKKDTVNINHTFVDPSLRGQGIAGKLMAALIDEITKRDLKVVPTCSYAQGWFRKHQEYGHLIK